MYEGGLLLTTINVLPIKSFWKLTMFVTVLFITVNDCRKLSNHGKCFFVFCFFCFFFHFLKSEDLEWIRYSTSNTPDDISILVRNMKKKKIH